MSQEIYGKKVNDWKITSLGDIGGFAGPGAKISHFRFYSPTLGKKANTVLIQVGFGVGGEVKLDLPKIVYSLYENLTKAKGAVTAEKNYTQLVCHIPFSLDDIDHANCGNIDTGIAIPFGYKSGFCHASSSDGRLMFSVPASVDPIFSVMVKMEASVSAGVFILLENRQYASMAASRREREFARTPSSPLVRPAGGF